MNLKQIRQQFRQISGRHDLVAPDGSDNGANFYINSGQRYLDKLFKFGKEKGIVYGSLATNDWYFQFLHCRAVKNVWISKSDQRWELDKETLQFVMTKYNAAPEDVDGGEPQYYAPMTVRRVPDDATYVETATILTTTPPTSLAPTTMLTTLATTTLPPTTMLTTPAPETLPPDETVLAGFTKYVQVLDSSSWGYNAVMFFPPVDEAMLIEVHGMFSAEPLVADGDTSYWSDQHDNMLIYAALRELEIAHRNSQGRKDWEAAIKETGLGIAKDTVEEEIADITQIEG